jgi:single-strand DNA-binding protein
VARSLNRVQIIGNLTRDPELRYTPQGHAVASFTIATNREWTTEGEKKESAEFHNVVSWNKLAELCAQLLSKGAKTYVEGRLQTRDWTGDDGIKRYKTEVVIDEMIVLSSKRREDFEDEGIDQSTPDEKEKAPNEDDEDVPAEDVPF